MNPPDYVVRLPGNDNSWSAADATGDTDGYSGPQHALDACVVRVLLKGEQMLGGGFVRQTGQKCRFNFRASDEDHEKLYIEDAFIMEAANPYAPTMDGDDHDLKRIEFGGHDDKEIDHGKDKWSDWVDLRIERDKSYLVSFLVNKKEEEGPRHGSPWVWRLPDDQTNNTCWIWVASDEPGDGEAKKEKWSDKLYDKVFPTNVVPALQFVFVSYPERGVFESL
jgi:hypothetical protein